MAAPGMEGSDAPAGGGGAEAGRRGSDVRSDCWVSVRQADADDRLEIRGAKWLADGS